MSKLQTRSRLNSLSTILLICDVQVRFQPLIYRANTVINRIALLNNVANVLKIPIIVTEQYPKAFGATVKEIELFPETQVFSKRKFSMMTEEVTAAFKILNRTNIILCGVESHVCVLQTALTFLQGDFKHEGEEACNVYVVCDAVSSQRSHDRSVALLRLKDAGAIMTTTESLLYEILGDSEHPDFKPVAKLLKESNEEINEFAGDSSY